MTTTDKYILIDRYHAGELSGAELDEFNKLLENDPDFAEEVKISKKIDSFFSKKDEEAGFYEQLEQIYSQEILSKGNSRNSRSGKLKLLTLIINNKVAAGFILLFSIGILLWLTCRPPKNIRLYNKYFVTYEASIGNRSTNNSNIASEKIEKALWAYDSANYQKAYLLFSDICSTKSDSIEFEAVYFKGLSAMNIEKFDDAIVSFKQIIESKNPTPYLELSEWYISLCYLHTNDLTQAKKNLTKICTDSSFYKPQAEKLLNELN